MERKGSKRDKKQKGISPIEILTILSRECATTKRYSKRHNQQHWLSVKEITNLIHYLSPIRVGRLLTARLLNLC